MKLAKRKPQHFLWEVSNRIATLPFNGYGRQVAHLYKGMDLRKWF